MPKDYLGDIVPQLNKPESKVRMFHGTPNKITNGLVEARKISNERMGFEDPGSIRAAFATSDIHMAAEYAGPTGHIYEVHDKPDEFDIDYSRYSHDILAKTDASLRIKQEVGFPGENLARRQHLDTGFNESRK